MRLTSKYRQYTVTTLVLVLFISFIVQYFLFRYSIHRTTDDVLNEYRIDIENYAAANDTLLPFRSLELKHSNLTVEADQARLHNIDETICDTLIFSHYENEMVVYRKMEFPVITSRHSYVVTVMLPTLEEHDLVGTVILSLVIIVLLFIVFSTVTNIFFEKKISRPFNNILDSIRACNIDCPTFVPQQHHGIDEFMELNRILQAMMQRINKDYNNMKDFLEDTSHELQTPLSIIQLKLEILQQKEDISEEQLQMIASINQAVSRIIRFNRALLLLAKINNNQFSQKEAINLNQVVGQFLELYQEMIEASNIRLKFRSHSVFKVEMHPMLAEQLVQNLLTNAVKHNYAGGEVEVEISERSCIIWNTFQGTIPADSLFEKYKCTPGKIGSNGLGLTIVKKICEKSLLDISYKQDGERFCMKIVHRFIPKQFGT